MIQLTATILLFPIYTTFSILLRVIRKLSNIFHAYIYIYKIGSKSGFHFLFAHISSFCSHSAYIVKINFRFYLLFIKKNVKYRKVNIN